MEVRRVPPISSVSASALSRRSAVAALIAAAALLIASGRAGLARGGSGGTVVGRQADGSVVVPTGQRITPAGQQVELSGRPNAVVIRPGGRIAAVLIASSGEQVRTVDVATGRVLSSSHGLAEGASYAGLAWAPDGSAVFASGADGVVAVISVAADGSLGATRRITIPTSTGGPNAFQNPYPGGLAVTPDGKTLVVALSRDNALGIVDIASGQLSARVPVGNAPHSVVVDGTTAFVTNEGGRPATPTDITNDSAGTRIVSDGFHGGSTTGTVSVVDLTARAERATIAVGLHPTALLLDGGRLFVADTNSDEVSTIDRTTLRPLGTMRVQPYEAAPYGAGPTGLAMAPGGRLVVTLGLANAAAVYDVAGAGGAAYEGLLPTAWYPSDVAYDAATQRVVIANLHGVGTTADADAGRTARGLNEVGSISIVELPGREALRGPTRQVFANNHWTDAETESPERTAEPRAIPGRIGEPSPITHVVYIVKENRTYDQVLGDIGRGNSDPSLAEFGEDVTPNTHALATQFPLMDNFYDSARRSNDGHQWAMQAAAPDYLEKGVSSRRSNVLGLGRGTPPSSGFDALLYLQSGFLWENALRHGKTFEDFGEYTVESQPPPAVSDIPSLEAHVVPEFSGFELTTPDVFRASVFVRHLQQYEASGTMPNLVHLTLPNDHTGGSNPLYPTPATQVADNDQGLGQIVDAISHSQFWSSTAIFVEEDDTQGGPDHVEGHRGPLLVVSPYARHGGVIDSTLYTQVSVVRTIEQILGLPPMNQLDAAAAPMGTAFTDTPDLTPYNARVPAVLARGPVPNPPVASLTGLRRLWAQASLAYDVRHIDAVNPALLNRDIWYSTHAWSKPYPGDARMLTPAEVIARYPTADD